MENRGENRIPKEILFLAPVVFVAIGALLVHWFDQPDYDTLSVNPVVEAVQNPVVDTNGEESLTRNPALHVDAATTDVETTDRAPHAFEGSSVPEIDLDQMEQQKAQQAYDAFMDQARSDRKKFVESVTPFCRPDALPYLAAAARQAIRDAGREFSGLPIEPSAFNGGRAISDGPAMETEKNLAGDDIAENRIDAISGTERAYYESFMLEAFDDPVAFKAHVDEVLAGAHELPNKVAALKAWYDAPCGGTTIPFDRVMLDSGNEDLLVAFCVRYLGSRIRTDQAAAGSLLGFLEAHVGTPDQRRAAYPRLIRDGSTADAQRSLNLLHLESDEQVVVAAAEALKEKKTATARGHLASLAGTHPVAAVRHRVEEIYKDKYCVDHADDPEGDW